MHASQRISDNPGPRAEARGDYQEIPKATHYIDNLDPEGFNRLIALGRSFGYRRAGRRDRGLATTWSLIPRDYQYNPGHGHFPLVNPRKFT
jgi:hypothetical protein